MVINGVTVANPVSIKRDTNYLQLRLEPLGGQALIEVEKGARLVVLIFEWDGLTEAELTALEARLETLNGAYAKITSSGMRGVSAGAAESDYVTLRPGTPISIEYHQETYPGLAGVPLLYTVRAEFLTYPHTYA